MGSVGDAYDNAMCESFFATLECEPLERRRFASQAEARAVSPKVNRSRFFFREQFHRPGIATRFQSCRYCSKMACFSFIEGWYSPVRLHSALGYRSPMAYEAAVEVEIAETS
jgi:putative transposase